jgi:hypothetical protein
MSILTCGGCGGITNSTTCDYLHHKDFNPRKCYVKWVDNKPVKGCGYDELKESALKSKGKYEMFYLKWISVLLKKG